ncbi:MAG TPA: 4-alpha-glucanotransferase, partial [Streptosporangiaceae bacterium]
MTSEETRRRAAARGVATSYRDWHDQQVQVADETLDAIVRALDAVGPSPQQPERGSRPEAGYAPTPDSRSWGFAVQLYSLRSRQSWGHGDLGDLADLATWSGADLGAGFLLINPLHAVEPLPPLSASPYLPMTRRFTSPLYLRVEDIPEYGTLTAGDRVR